MKQPICYLLFTVCGFDMENLINTWLLWSLNPKNRKLRCGLKIFKRRNLFFVFSSFWSCLTFNTTDFDFVKHFSFTYVNDYCSWKTTCWHSSVNNSWDVPSAQSPCSVSSGVLRVEEKQAAGAEMDSLGTVDPASLVW